MLYHINVALEQRVNNQDAYNRILERDLASAQAIAESEHRRAEHFYQKYVEETNSAYETTGKLRRNLGKSITLNIVLIAGIAYIVTRDNYGTR